MYYTARIRLLTPFLGNQVENGIRKFRHSQSEPPVKALAFDSSLWQWAFKSVHRSREQTWSRDAVVHKRNWETKDKIELYTRQYRRQNIVIDERFESLDVGAELEIVFGIWAHDAAGEPGPDVLQFSQMLEDVGEFAGLSPWGSKFGYGRFTLESLKPQNAKT